MMLFPLADFLQKAKLKKINDTLIILFYVSPGLLKYRQFDFLFWRGGRGRNTPILVLKRMFRHVLKSPPLNKILEFQDQKKRLGNFYKKENFKPKIKVMIENLQDELNQ